MENWKSRLKSRLRQRLEGVVVDDSDRPVWSRLWSAVVALAYVTTREVFRDRAPITAAGLAFFTVLAVVPLLTVAAALLDAFGVFDAGGSEIFARLDRLFPDAASGVASYLGDMATGSSQSLGGIGGLTLLIIGLVLFNYIEETLTRIWGGTLDRSLMKKLLTFYAVISFGPVLIALSIVQTARAQIVLNEIGLDISFVGRLAPFFYALVAFILIYRMVPNAEVTWRAALVGGLFSAVVFELAKWGFNLYISQMMLQTYNRVYGAVALIPIGLIWVYISWLVTLIGAELAYSFQHLRSLRDAAVERLFGTNRPGWQGALHPLVALEVLAPVLSRFEHGGGPTSAEEMAARSRLDAAIIADILARWEEQGVLVRMSGPDDESRRYLPAKPLETVRLDVCLSGFWPDKHHGEEQAFRQVAEGYRQISQQFFGERTGRDLVTAPDEDDTAAPSQDRAEQSDDARAEQIESRRS